MSAPDADLDDGEREALDMLRGATDAGDDLTDTVTLGDAEVTVTTKLTGELEDKFDQITEAQDADAPRLGELKDVLIDVITLLVVDDDESGRYDFQSRAVWEALYYDTGTAGLVDVFETVAEPALSRYERLGDDDRDGGGG